MSTSIASDVVVVPCYGQRHRVEVAGRRIVCLDEDEALEAVAETFGSNREFSCVAVARAARKVVRSRLGRNASARSLIVLALTQSPDRVVAWSRLGILSMEDRDLWDAPGEEVDLWARVVRRPVPPEWRPGSHDIPAYQAGKWIERGVDPAEAARWQDAVGSAGGHHWRDLGFTPEDAARWRQKKFGPKRSAAWREAGFSAPDAKVCAGLGFTPDVRWLTVTEDDRTWVFGATNTARMVWSPLAKHDRRSAAFGRASQIVSQAIADGWAPSAGEWDTETVALSRTALGATTSGGLLAARWSTVSHPSSDDRVRTLTPEEPGVAVSAPLDVLAEQRRSPGWAGIPIGTLSEFITPGTEISGWGTKTGRVIHLNAACRSTATLERTTPAHQSPMDLCPKCIAGQGLNGSAPHAQAAFLATDTIRRCGTGQRAPWVWTDRWQLATAARSCEQIVEITGDRDHPAATATEAQIVGFRRWSASRTVQDRQRLMVGVAAALDCANGAVETLQRSAAWAGLNQAALDEATPDTMRREIWRIKNGHLVRFRRFTDRVRTGVGSDPEVDQSGGALLARFDEFANLHLLHNFDTVFVLGKCRLRGRPDIAMELCRPWIEHHVIRADSDAGTAFVWGATVPTLIARGALAQSISSRFFVFDSAPADVEAVVSAAASMARPQWGTFEYETCDEIGRSFNLTVVSWD